MNANIINVLDEIALALFVARYFFADEMLQAAVHSYSARHRATAREPCRCDAACTSGQSNPASKKAKLDPIVGVYIESQARADVFKTDLRLEKSFVNTPAGPQDVIKTEVLWQRWENEP